MFQIKDRDATKPLRAVHYDPAVIFSRMRIVAGGVVCEDISDANRLSLMLDLFSSEDEQTNRTTIGLSTLFTQGVDDDFGDAILQNSRIAMFTPAFGLFKQDKLIPLRYCILQIELELVSNMSDAFQHNGGTYTANWGVTDIQCKCDLLIRDNSLDNEYASLLLSGKSLPISFSTWNHTNQSTGGDKNFSAHITRALTRLNSVFITLQSFSANAEHSINKHVIFLASYDR